MINFPGFVKSALMTTVFLSSPLFFQGQDSTHISHKTKNIFWYTPSGAYKINGVAAGLQAVNVHCDSLFINGLNADISMIGMMALPYVVDYYFSGKKKKIEGFMLSDSAGLFINGISLSMMGEFSVSVNGISLAGGFTGGCRLNGLSCSGLVTRSTRFNGILVSGIHNYAVKGRGLQIGLFNTCKDLKGLQIGIWNKSGKRGLPLLNWGI